MVEHTLPVVESTEAKQPKEAPAKSAPEQEKTAKTTAISTEIKELSWEDLMPPVDDRMVQQYNEGKLSREQAMEYMKKLGETPVEKLDNLRVEIPGYLVPLSLGKDKKAKELLLVPTLGACIHVPPPPPNQTIYIRYDKGISVTEAGYTPYISRHNDGREKQLRVYRHTVCAGC